MCTQREEEKGDTKMSGLYREEPLREGQPSPWAGKSRVEGRVSWENLEARSTLICKLCTPVLYPGVETKHRFPLDLQKIGIYYVYI